MASKQAKMLDYLLKQVGYTPIHQICTECQVSQRTVYHALATFKEDPQFIVENIKKGVRVRMAGQDSSNASKLPGDYEERKMWMFRKGLMMQQQLNVDSLLNYLSISEATLHSDVIRIRREIAKFHVKFVLKDGYLMFVGNYHDLKKLTQHIIYDENNEKQALLSIAGLTEIFPNLDVQYIKDSLAKELAVKNIFMDEYSVTNLLLHILISLNQELNGVVPVNINDHIQISEIVTSLCKPIEEKYNFNFSEGAKQQFTLILDTRAKSEDSDFDKDKLKNVETSGLVNEIFEKLLINYNLDLNVSMLKHSFILHLDNLITRLKNGAEVNNPLYNVIKRSAPITYDLAVYVSNIISSQMKHAVSESEIGYIALHIGTRIEEIKSERTRLKAMIVCPEYYAYHTHMNKIEEIYHEDLFITNVYTSFDEIQNFSNVDMILSTIMPAGKINTVPILKVTCFLNHSDRKNITMMISDIKNNRRIKQSRQIMKSLFAKELFFSDIAFESKDEIMDFLSDQLIKNHYVSKDYKEAVFYRERIAPTDFNVVAIPHPADYNAKQTVISTALLNKPVLWNRSEIFLVFMVALNNRDFESFEDILSSLITITSDMGNVKKLLAMKSYEEFITCFVSMLNSENDSVL